MKHFFSQNKRAVSIALHAFFLTLVLIAVCLLYFNSDYGRGFAWLQNHSYADTTAFSDQFARDVDAVFQYSKYRQAFETNHALDMSKSVVTVSDGNPDNEQTYSLEYMVDYAERKGYVLDKDWNIQEITVPEENYVDEEPLLVEWKSYDPNPQYSEPIDAYMTMTDLAYEVLSCLAEYSYVYYDLINSPSNFHFLLSYWEADSEDVKPLMYTNTDMSADEFRQQGRYVMYSLTSLQGEYNLSEDPLYIPVELDEYNPYEDGSGTLMAAVDTSYPVTDAYSEANSQFLQAKTWYIYGLALLGIGLVGCLITFGFLIRFAQWTDPSQSKQLSCRFDCLPAEISLLVSILLILAGLYLCKTFAVPLAELIFNARELEFIENFLNGIIIYIVSLLCVFSFVRQYKGGRLWSHSLIRRVVKDLHNYLVSHRLSSVLLYLYLGFLAVNLAFAFVAEYLFHSLDSLFYKVLFAFIILLWAAMDIWIFRTILQKVMQQDDINNAIFKISEGDTRYCVDLKQFTGQERMIAEHINSIGSGLDTAIQERVKSERMKTDLITNVSHDLKTPLTSIINYVGLIKRENIQNPRVQEYLEILEQKSLRLKTLTEDLVEASKASSGNVKLEMADIDFVELVHQSNGEFEEKFALRKLELISSLPNEPILIRADGGYLWRVLENLYNNAYKYAMADSRIYVDISRDEQTVTFTMKNISEHPLNISGEELTERFVRGDSSRTTEGSGLGLSIAQSLTRLQNGTFTLSIDGDLFKASVQFPIINAGAQPTAEG